MKCLFVLCLLGLVALSVAAPDGYPRGCIWIMGRCSRECPEGTHGYSTNCGRRMPEATCDNPHPVLEEGMMCDYSACYCDSPTVRNKATGQCVPLDQCPKQ